MNGIASSYGIVVIARTSTMSWEHLDTRLLNTEQLISSLLLQYLRHTCGCLYDNE